MVFNVYKKEEKHLFEL
ncbi:MAG TPA: hypothetical protein VEY70_23065 [Metabacillus sp.]|nr:hypothetical protein [Metabacillus sp.]